jgi:hypothetical protein
MKFLLVFENSGDSITFDPVNQEILEFYIEQLNQQSLNGFFSTDRHYGQKILDRINAFDSTIVEVNKWLYELIDIKIDAATTEEYLSQKFLNKLHADWVNSQSLLYNIPEKRKQFNFSGLVEKIHEKFPDNIPTPPLSDVLSKLELSDIYKSLNDTHIHGLESIFNNIQYTVSDTWTIISNNYFPKSSLTNNVANLKLSFNHLGRTLYNKFQNFDRNLDCNDENSFNELLGFVTLSLMPVQTIPLSTEYQTWCKQHNKVPSGDFLNIGNIPDLYENLTNYRIIIFRNLLDNNKFSIHKKGK